MIGKFSRYSSYSVLRNCVHKTKQNVVCVFCTQKTALYRVAFYYFPGIFCSFYNYRKNFNVYILLII